LVLRLEIRGGLLDGWRQATCTQATANRHLASTPAEWSTFATINAELAASLRG
jgi:hypothetical protein